ncbi:MAG TPA: hypothetical protein VFG04_11685 [Planctomycetaceae bacterium]|nr:hypothetical protein [Planctomycetaceae bacterium]
MSIRFSCSCGRKLKVSDEKIGMKVLCSSCGATLKVPKKSQDEYWQDVPAKNDGPKTDYAGGIKEFLIHFLPGGLVVGLMCWFAYFLSNQILTGKGNTPPLGQVVGKVTMAGQPLANATVRFAPKDPIYGEGQNGKHLAASVSISITDDNGHYNLLYVKDTNGAYVGQHKVTIEAKDASGRERVRSDFNTRSTLEREVKAGSQTMDFDVQDSSSAPGSTPAPTTAPQVQP